MPARCSLAGGALLARARRDRRAWRRLCEHALGSRGLRGCRDCAHRRAPRLSCGHARHKQKPPRATSGPRPHAPPFLSARAVAPLIWRSGRVESHCARSCVLMQSAG
eukprot:1091013-Prymnesium_polylepis.1